MARCLTWPRPDNSMVRWTNSSRMATTGRPWEKPDRFWPSKLTTVTNWPGASGICTRNWSRRNMRYVILRDDDTNALTPVEYLERLYRPFLDNGFPVNLATIPNVRTDVTYGAGIPEG